jgi:hypothetical protein
MCDSDNEQTSEKDDIGINRAKNDLPFLQLNLRVIGTGLCTDELLEITHRVIWAAFNSH